MASVKMITQLSTDVEQPDTPYDKYYDYFLDVETDDGLTTRIEVNTHTTGGFQLMKWKLIEKHGTPCVKVFLQISAMGHDLDQWVTYDLTTGERYKK